MLQPQLPNTKPSFHQIQKKSPLIKWLPAIIVALITLIMVAAIFFYNRSTSEINASDATIKNVPSSEPVILNQKPEILQTITAETDENKDGKENTTDANAESTDTTTAKKQDSSNVQTIATAPDTTTQTKAKPINRHNSQVSNHSAHSNTPLTPMPTINNHGVANPNDRFLLPQDVPQRSRPQYMQDAEIVTNASDIEKQEAEIIAAINAVQKRNQEAIDARRAEIEPKTNKVTTYIVVTPPATGTVEETADKTQPTDTALNSKDETASK